MPLKSILEIVVQLDRFVNIDLSQQGLYQLQISCYYQLSQQKIYAVPITYTYSKSSREDLIKVDPHNIISGYLDEKLLCVHSKTFLIRYSEEKVKLNEVATFRLEIEVTENFSQIPLTLQLDLLYGEVSAKKPLVQSTHQVSYENVLSVVKSRNFIISYPLKGLHDFLPGFFGSRWFCAVEGIVHVIFYDYKLPYGDMHTFVNQLFADKKGRLKSFIGASEIDEKYNEYISILAQVHEGMRKHIDQLANICSLGEAIKLQALRLPLIDENDGDASSRNFSEKLGSSDPYTVCENLLRESKLLAGFIYQAFIQLRDIIVKNPRKTCKYFKRIYEDRLMERYGEFVVREIHRKWEFDICGVENSRKLHKITAKSMRRSPYFMNLEFLPLQEESLFPVARLHPIMFEQIFYAENDVNNENLIRTPSGNPIEDMHVIVLVHGFQGNSYDLKIVKNYIGMVYPRCFFLESTSNENRTEGDIQEMGFRLSKELIHFLSEWCPDETPEISFIGHSLGGLIIRAALPYLSCLSDKMRLFLTLSTPHLGVMYSSKILDAGMWVLKKFKKFLSMKQLCFEDHESVEGTFLYKLSKYEGLEWFKYVVLVSSAQDKYAPFDSARMEVPPRASRDAEKGNLYINMVHNLLNRLTLQKLIKLDVNFKLNQSIDTMIGRKAHMQFLENEGFLRMLVYRYPEFFS
ncbi:unnamed protein product [Blepharisma stoltei]|uniref:DUF676 domain-containing protein n=1 Tax=Blepharisma stoltei TaxID=1481888 RepID=A0AAU9JAF1_9CILI|nr:unnamed protein product [Blepharisma stoltei]